MKILLVNPPQWAAYGTPMLPVYPPLGLLQLAACLEDDSHEVRVLDSDAEGASISDLVRWVRSHNPDLVGFTATTPSYPAAMRWAARVRSVSSCPVILGGPHASALPNQVLDTGCFDYLIQGEAEYSLPGLIRSLQESETGSRIPGVWRMKSPPPEPPVLLTEKEYDSLPNPAWHLLKRPAKYNPPDATALPVGTMAVTRGCPGTCRFCQAPVLFGKRVRYLSAEKVLEQAWLIHKTIAAKEIHLIDDCFTAGKKNALAVCRILASSGPPVCYSFGNGLRADMLDRELLAAFKDMNVHSIGLGIETANKEIAARAGKKVDLEQCRTVILSARKLGLRVWAFFMYGLPGETIDSMEQTARLARDLPLDIAKFEIFKPYPGTALFDELSVQGAIKATNWERWGIHTTPVHSFPDLKPRDVMRSRREAILGFYLRPKFLMSAIFGRSNLRRTVLNLRALGFLLKSMIPK